MIVNASDRLRLSYGDDLGFCLEDGTGRSYLPHPDANRAAWLLDDVKKERDVPTFPGSTPGPIIYTYRTPIALPHGKLNLGERLQGTLGFQVDQGTVGLDILVLTSSSPGVVLRLNDLSQCVTASVRVELGPQPISLEPPANLPGEESQQLFNIGDVVDHGQARILVSRICATRVDVGSIPGPCDRYTGDIREPLLGGITVIVELTVENLGATAWVPIRPGMFLKDPSGRRIRGGWRPLFDDVVPGDVIQTGVSFIVPDSFRDLDLVFGIDINEGWFGGADKNDSTSIFITIPSDVLGPEFRMN